MCKRGCVGRALGQVVLRKGLCPVNLMCKQEAAAGAGPLVRALVHTSRSQCVCCDPIRWRTARVGVRHAPVQEGGGAWAWRAR